MNLCFIILTRFHFTPCPYSIIVGLMKHMQY